MIKLKGEPGQKEGCKIEFTKRASAKGNHPAREFELLYGHRCPACGMVIQALFLIKDQPVDLGPYEETDVVNREGEIKKVIPNAEEATAYESDILRYGDGRKVQRIRLRNHLLKAERLGSDEPWEPGARTCVWTGVFSLRDDLAVKDVVLAAHVDMEDLSEYRLQSTRDLLPQKELPPRIKERPIATGTLVEVPAFGDAPPVILLSRRDAHDGWEHTMKLRLSKVPKREPQEDE